MEETAQNIRPWLENTLVSITEADVAALADYVQALLNHQGSRDELYQKCISSLQDFLQENTAPFVDAMFQEIDRMSSNNSDPQNLQPESHGQEHFRNNFRNDRNRVDMEFNSGSNQNNGAGNLQAPPQAGFWSNGIFLPYPVNGTMPIPNNQGFFPLPPRKNNHHSNNNQRGGNHLKTQGPKRGKKRDRSDLSSRRKDADGNNTNRFIIVERLPEDKFNEQDLTEYFANFGTLKNVVLHRDKQVAEIEFETHQQADAAYSSPAPIFDNRFVKVFWKVRPLDDKGEPIVDMESIRQIQEQRQREFEAKRQERQEKEAQIKESLERKAIILQKRKEQQELLLKIAEKEGKSEEITEKKSTTDALKQQLEALKAEAQSLGISTSSPSGRGGYGFRGRGGARGRGTFRGRGGASFHPYSGASKAPSRTLDMRPKNVLVENVPQDKQEAMRSHLLSVADVETVATGSKPDSLLVQFKNRHNAEKFYYSDSNIADVGQVEKSWQRDPMLNGQEASAGAAAREGESVMDTGS